MAVVAAAPKIKCFNAEAVGFMVVEEGSIVDFIARVF